MGQSNNRPSQQAVIAIDQGTFSSRCMLFSEQGRQLFNAQQAVSLNRVDTQQIEQDGNEILCTVQSTLQQALEYARANRIEISSAGLATQRSSIIAWRLSSGQTLGPVLSWQDTRAADWLKSFAPHQQLIQHITGLRLSAHYGVSKMHWLLQNNTEIQKALQQQDCVITPLASFLLYHLLHNQPVAIDSANAARSLLLNYRQQNWDQYLLDLFEIPRQILADCQPVCSDYGTLKNTTITLCAVNGDQNAALYSHGKPAFDSLRVNLGTGAFILTPLLTQQMATKAFEDSGLLGGISSSDENDASYTVEGTVNGAGAALQWLAEQYPQIDVTAILQRNLSAITPPVFINSVGGMGSPFWRSDIEPQFLDDFDPVEHPQQAVAAIIESIVFLLHINYRAIQRVKDEMTHIVISGGLSASDTLCQKLANLCNLPVQRSVEREATARGIAWLANLHKNGWKKGASEKVFKPQPDIALSERFECFYQALPS